MASDTATFSFKLYSKNFWTANTVELLERAAYYGVFVVLTLYLSRILGFSDFEAGVISGLFSGGLYLLPTFSGALADKIGFKKSLLLAFLLLSIGYIFMGILPTVIEAKGLASYSEITQFSGLKSSGYRYYIVPILFFIMIGGSFIKSVITGTIARETTESTRAKGFSIFYMMVNIGAFSGKTIVKPLREAMGNEGLIVLNYFAAAMTLIALVLVYIIYKSHQSSEETRKFKDILHALGKILTNAKLLVLILIITGFWLVQQQLYATMPKYVLRMAGEDSSPAWYANVNPLVVFLFVGLITGLMKNKSPLYSMTIGMFIMPISALCMAMGNLLPPSETLLGMHPIAFMMIVGIAFQGLSECFISPRFLEYFSLQSPKGEEGLYLGFSHLHSFFSSIIGFILSGLLLEKFCPDPAQFHSHEAWQSASQNAHYIWFIFMGIAILSAILLAIYGKFVRER